MTEAAAATVLASHAINQTLDRLVDASETGAYIESRELLDDNRKATFDRAFLFARKLQGLIASATDADVSLTGLTVINNGLSNALNEINAFFSNKNPGHVDNASSHLDAATTTAAWTFFNVPTKGNRSHGESISSIQKAASEAITSVRSQQAEIGTDFAQSRESIEAQQQALAKLTEQISTNQQASDAAVSEIRTSFQTLESEFRRTMDEAEVKKATSFEVLVKKLERQASGVLNTLAEHEASAKRIVQIVGNVGVTGNYQNRATSERDQANYLRLGAISFFVVGAFILAASVFVSFDGEFDPVQLLARAIVALTISAPAFYLAKESARHRSNADQAKQTELELASLTPFLEALPEEKRQEVIGSLSGAYFGTKVEKHDISHPAELSADQILKLVVQLVDGQRK